MSYDEFCVELEKIGMMKKEFAILVGMSEGAVTNWSNVDRVARWVPSWLENYSKAKKVDDLKEFIKESGLCS
jgi:hypothetical protein